MKGILKKVCNWANFKKVLRPRPGSYLAVVILSIASLLFTLTTLNASENTAMATNEAQGVSKLISTDSMGNKANKESSYPAISPDGRYVAFTTTSSNLVPNDLNGYPDLFIKDTQTGTTICASDFVNDNQGGLSGDTYSSYTKPIFSADSRFVVYVAKKKWWHSKQIYLKDLKTGEAKVVSSTQTGEEATNDCSDASISANGRFVAFSSQASNLVPNGNDTKAYIFVKDMRTGAIIKASTNSSGEAANNFSYNPVISADGTHVSFQTEASNLVDDDTNNVMDLFVKNLKTDEIVRASTDKNGNQGNHQSNESFDPSISADGTLVTFSSTASNLVPNDNGTGRDVFLKNIETGAISILSTSSTGEKSTNNSTSSKPWITLDGHYVAFSSDAQNLTNNTNGYANIFLKNTWSGHITKISVNSSGAEGNGVSNMPSLSANGERAVFQSYAYNLIPQDSDGKGDIFLSNQSLDQPLIQNITPTGWISNTNPVIGADFVAANNFQSASITLDDSELANCEANSSHIGCPSENLYEGVHSILVSLLNDNKRSNRIENFGIDVYGPLFLAMSEWTNQQTINASFTDEGIGMDKDKTIVKLDGSVLENCAKNASSVKCDNLAMAEGSHQVEITIQDLLGKSTTKSGVLTLEKTNPVIANITPTGAQGREFEISADLSDSGSGINDDATILKVNNVDVTAQTVRSSDHISYKGNGEGTQNVRLEVQDRAGNTEAAEWSFSTPSPGCFTWYDNVYGRTWVMMASPLDSAGNLFDLYLGTQLMNPDQRYGVAPGQTAPQIYGGKMGGPVKVVPYSQAPALISERSLFGNSFEEIWATPYESLDSHYFWPAYDQSTSGMQNWVLVANPRESSDAVEAEVRLHIPDEYGGDKVVTKVIAPGESWAPSFPGIRTGPVEVQAWKANNDRGNPTNARKVIASQRVLWNGAFNEMPGIPQGKLSSAYVWTWYDNNSPQAYNEILIADAEMTGEGGSPYVKVVIGDYLVFAGYIHSEWTTVLRSPKGSPSGMGGPVFVYSCNDPEKCDGPGQPIFASQRIFWGPSFGEIAGTPIEKITDNAHWTWYDQLTPGVVNWVLASNLTGNDAYAEFRIGEKLVGTAIIQGWKSYTPTFPNYMDGPVQVKAWKSELDASGQQKKASPAYILASQRVLWNGYFNEIVGQGL